MTLAHRIEEYYIGTNYMTSVVGADSPKLWSQRRTQAAEIIPEHELLDIIESIAMQHSDNGDPWIDQQFFLGTAQHETSFAVNERDTEVDGFQSWGVYQVSEEECASVALPGARLMLDPREATEVYYRLALHRRTEIREAAGLTEKDTDDLSSYLAIAHNLGMGECRRTIKEHGMNWAKFKERNPKLRIVSSGYGDAVRAAHVLSISGLSPAE